MSAVTSFTHQASLLGRILVRSYRLVFIIFIEVVEKASEITCCFPSLQVKKLEDQGLDSRLSSQPMWFLLPGLLATATESSK